MRRFALGVILAIGLYAAPVQAVVVTFDYEGIGIPGGFGDTTGATITGQFGWDTGVADTGPDAQRGEYPMAGFWRGAISGGPQDGLTFDAAGLDIVTRDNTAFGGSGDSLQIYVFNLFPTSSATFVSLLDGSPSDGLDGPALPLDIDLADWSVETRLAITGFDFGLLELPGTNQYNYELTEVTLRTSEVPLPASIYAFAAALLLLRGLGGLRRRRGT